MMKNVLKDKKSALWLILLSVLSCIILAVCFLTNQAAEKNTLKLTDAGNSPDGKSCFANFEIHMGNEIGGVKLVAEQWKEGERVQSGAVSMGEYSGKIDIRMDVRYEENSPVGVEIQFGAQQNGGDQNGGSTVTYFSFSEEKPVSGWSFKSYEVGEKIQILPDTDKILAAMAFDEGAGVRVFAPEVLVSDPERLEQADHMVVIRASFHKDVLEQVAEQAAIEEMAENLSLDDVISLSQKGEELTWSDFEEYDYYETGSGLYIRVYEIDETFSLWLGGGSLTEKPMYIRLKAENEEYIDIREVDAEEFVEKQRQKKED